MADGYVLAVVSPEGGRILLEEIKCPDIMAQDHARAWMFDSGFRASIEAQIPEETKDALALITFRKESIPCGSWEAPESEWDDDFIVEHTLIVTPRYKEFWRGQISFTLACGAREPYHSPNNDDDESRTLIESWEEFYGEDFVLSDPRPKAFS